MHQKIIKDIIANLDSAHSRFFGAVLSALEQDSRTEVAPNLVYAVLKEVVPLIPPYLPVKDFNNLLFKFIGENSTQITTVMFSSQYVTDSSILQSVTNEFVDQIVETTYQLHKAGKIDTGEKKVLSYSWPYDNADFPFADK